MQTNQQTRAAIAGVSGTVLQWYDFSLFGYLAPIIAKTYFPKVNQFIALLSTFGVFAVGFLLAPLGALWLGHLGDKYGRKYVLTLTVICISISTAAIAFLPSYAQIGMLAPIGLTLCRLLQGLVSSAEFAGSAIFLVEHAPVNKKSFFGSLASFSYTAGMIIGAGVCSLLTAKFMPHWAWRCSFVLAVFGAWIVLYLRHRVAETPEFTHLIDQHAAVKLPIVNVLKQALVPFIITIALAAFIGIYTYGTYVYMVTYLHVYLYWSLAFVTGIVTLALIADTVTEPIIAYLTERYGRLKMMLLGTLLTLVLMLPIFKCLTATNPWLVGGALVMISLLIALAYAHANAFMVELFPVNCRFSGFSVAFNIGITIFGGTTPMVMTWLIHTTQHLFAPAFYYLAASTLGLIAISFAAYWQNKSSHWLSAAQPVGKYPSGNN
ncbi:MAG: MFS transporter [Pseudomonadota bacterium]